MFEQVEQQGCGAATLLVGTLPDRAEVQHVGDGMVKEADVVITMGCGDACPIYPGKRYEDWELEDPEGKDLETVRRIRDEIDERVQRLIRELDTDRHASIY